MVRKSIVHLESTRSSDLDKSAELLSGNERWKYDEKSPRDVRGIRTSLKRPQVTEFQFKND